jgi:hypothetical protein
MNVLQLLIICNTVLLYYILLKLTIPFIVVSPFKYVVPFAYVVPFTYNLDDCPVAPIPILPVEIFVENCCRCA